LAREGKNREEKNMVIETYKTITGQEKKLLRAGKIKGQNILKKEGFVTGTNPDWYIKGNVYAHYNKLMKVWVLDEPLETKDGMLIFV